MLRRFHIARDLLAQRGQVLKLLLGPQVPQESQLDVFPVEILIEIEDVKLEHALRDLTLDRRAHAEIDHPAESFPLEQSLRRIDAVRRKLLAVRAQVRGRETKTAPEMLPLLHRAEDGVTPPEHSGRGFEIACLDRPPNRSAAHDRAFGGDRLDANNIEIELSAEFFQERQIAGAIFAERPFLADTDFA